MSKSNVKNLTIEELCIYDSSRYIVPIYQRNYAWGDKEIRELIQDINTAMKRNQGKNYYLGSLVVCRKDDGIFEVIDGQQRLTTLNILLACLGHDKRIPLGFKHRRAADESLEKLTKIPDIALLDKNDSIQEGYIIAKNIFQDYDIKINKESFKNFLLKNVRIIQTEVPHDTNLNHYFEIMNNRGEQLEKHEILKTRLMNILDNSSRYTFAKIWDACSDMQRYAIMSIKSDVREQIFGKNWTLLPKDFKEIIDIYHKNIDLDNNCTKITLDDIANPDYEHKEINTKNDHDIVSYNSVVDFHNFLLYTYHIYIEFCQSNISNDIEKTSLDDKNLLEHFDILKELEQVENFIVVLLRCRLLFDKYIIKSSPLKNSEWVLRQVQPRDSTSSYNDTFSDSGNANYKLGSNNIIIMIESMFHVSTPSKNGKYWLYATLRWLFLEYRNNGNINAEKFINFLHNLCDRFYFGRYNGTPQKFIDLILNSENFTFSPVEGNIWKKGTDTPHFIFHRLEYLLWYNFSRGNFSVISTEKEEEIQKHYNKFYFSFRNSIEHFKPQNSRFQSDQTKQNLLDDFGNLCLLSRSDNSKLSNETPYNKKRLQLESGRVPSLKQLVMMTYINNESTEWDDKTITEHGEKMISLLNRPI